MIDLAVDEHTHLRSVRMDDASELYALVDANRTHLRRWLVWVDETKSEESIRQFIKAAVDQETDGGGPVCCIVHRDRMDGTCGFKPIDKGNRSIEIGYWLGESATGSGIMTRCVESLVGHAFQSLAINRIELRAATANTQSRAVAERLGFTHEGDLRESERLPHGYVDQAVYSILKREWSKLV